MKKLIAVIMFGILALLQSSSGVIAQSDVIADKNDAAAFCRELPGGASSVGFDYCAFTEAGAGEPCVVSSQGSFPKFSESCNTYKLSEMVGKSRQMLKDDTARGGGTSTQPSSGSGSDELDSWLKKIVNLLSAIVGIVIITSIIFAGIQYTTAGSNAAQVSAAKNRITMSIISLILFLFTYTILQWLIPGGISILN